MSWWQARPPPATGLDSYLVVVSGVNPHWGDQMEFAVVVRSGPVREATTQPHQNQGITAYETIRLLLTQVAFGPDTALALPVEVVWPKEKTGHP